MALSTSTYQPMTIYERDVDQWILGAYRTGAQDFWQLVSMLPAVYPTVVRQAVERLIAASVIPADLAVERSMWDSSGVSGTEVPGLPTPNPLAFDWRYTRDTAGELLERVVASTGPTQTVALLGSPSVYKMAAIQEAPRQFILLDKNGSLSIDVSQSLLRSTLRRCDVEHDEIDLPPVQAVLADPPWYEDETLAFLRAAARICADQGKVLLSSAPDGVRPGIREERKRIISGAVESGLRFLGNECRVLSYATPFFEHNALRAAGFAHVAPNWRRGDLLKFERTGDSLPGPLNPIAHSAEWEQVDISGATIWIRVKDQPGFIDPRLVPLVPGDILPTVSRRDGRREAADVWTAGNRIYRCDGSHILSLILHAISVSKAPLEEVQQNLQHSLDHLEAAKVEASVAQVGRIIQTELQEMRSFGNGWA